MVNHAQMFDLKKDLKKETVSKEVPNESLKLLLIKDAQKEGNKHKDSLPQRDNSKATSQKEDKFEKMRLSNNLNAINKDQPHTPSQSTQSTQFTSNKDTKDQTPPVDESHLDLADLLIGTITGHGKMADFRNNANSSSSNSKQSSNSSTGTSTFDDLRIKVIEQVHLKAKIFFNVFSQALNSNQLLRETASSIKNKNDGLVNKINSIYSSTPYLKPYQAGTRPPANNNFCQSLASSFQQYSQLNAFLLAAFLLFPITIPFYLFGWVILFLTRSLFCIGAKQIVTNIIYRIRSS